MLVYQRKGSTKWYIKGLRKSTGTDDRAEAEALAARLKHEKWLEEKMGIKRPRRWQEAVLQWLEEKAHKRSLQDDKEKLKWLDGYLGSVEDINKIDRELVHKIMQDRGVSPDKATPVNSTANKFVVLIAGILNAAEREWGWGNRAPRLRYYPISKDKGKALTPEEWAKLVPKMREHFRLMATFLVSTGLRAGKVYDLQWNQIDMIRGTLTFEGTENKLGNTIPLNETAWGVLKAIRSGKVVHKTHVFTYGGKPVKGYGRECWRGALERAGIDRMRLHDLRHTFNSWLAQNGVSREIRMRLVGHSMGDSHDRYTHLDVEHLRPYSRIIDTVIAQSGGQTQLKQLNRVG